MKKPLKDELFSKMFQEPIPESGPVTIIKENIKTKWKKTLFIDQYGGKFYLKDSTGRRVNIFPDDASWIIEELKLYANPHPLFRQCIIWATSRNI